MAAKKRRRGTEQTIEVGPHLHRLSAALDSCKLLGSDSQIGPDLALAHSALLAAISKIVMMAVDVKKAPSKKELLRRVQMANVYFDSIIALATEAEQAKANALEHLDACGHCAADYDWPTKKAAIRAMARSGKTVEPDRLN